ncbi:GNAT family N-acetyltransferase [Anaerolentibacter hominis]|uniref:GNAT family N-acetyltransferase n=1 Tax=Anaerolentibacter hominis TaxID=3079009 RepID=UPI0031B81E65
MDIKKLDRTFVSDIYHTHMQEAFPQAELKPLKTILMLMELNLYEGYGLFEEGRLLAYALLVRSRTSSCTLLDYYAVCREYRDRGLGSTFLQKLRDAYQDTQGILIETEDIDRAENEEEKNIRTRRVQFYERNGAVRTGIKACVFTVDYRVFYLPVAGKPDDEMLFREFEDIYHTLVPEKYYESNVFITMD